MPTIGKVDFADASSLNGGGRGASGGGLRLESLPGLRCGDFLKTRGDHEPRGAPGRWKNRETGSTSPRLRGPRFATRSARVERRRTVLSRAPHRCEWLCKTLGAAITRVCGFAKPWRVLRIRTGDPPTFCRRPNRRDGASHKNAKATASMRCGSQSGVGPHSSMQVTQQRISGRFAPRMVRREPPLAWLRRDPRFPHASW